ncbi:MAG: DUF4333 domain-containing protein [Actinomycetota bacterium]|nr:DUF4333 domain-containing protein [Actinomycetota bacterium]
MQRGIAIACVAVLGVLAGCGGKKFDTAKLERSIKQAAERDLHFPLRSVKCPADIKVTKGNVFYCRAVSKSGSAARVRVTQRDDQGHVLIAVPA